MYFKTTNKYFTWSFHPIRAHRAYTKQTPELSLRCLHWKVTFKWLLSQNAIITTSKAYQFSRRVYLTPKSSIDPPQTIWSQEENLQNLCGPEIRGWSIRTCLPPLFLSLSLSVPGLYTLLKVNDFLALCLYTWLWGQSVLKMKWYKLSFMLPQAVLYIRQVLHWLLSLCQ